MLNDIAKHIWSLARAHLLFLHVTWVPRSLNQAADALSHFHDVADWSLNPSIFQHLYRTWSPFTVDRFANHTNHLLPRFNSCFWCPGSSAIDAFLQSDWTSSLSWCFPPFPSFLGCSLSLFSLEPRLLFCFLFGLLVLGGLLLLMAPFSVLSSKPVSHLSPPPLS